MFFSFLFFLISWYTTLLFHYYEIFPEYWISNNDCSLSYTLDKGTEYRIRIDAIESYRLIVQE